MIVEQRDYHVHTGKLPSSCGCTPRRGSPSSRRSSAVSSVRSRPTSGALSTYTSLWGYESFAEREERRAALQARPDWQAFLARIQPLIHTQQNRILVPTAFSPIA